MSGFEPINDNDLNKHRSLVNDKDINLSLNNDNDAYKGERISSLLVDRFGSEDSRAFYVLVADKLPEGVIMNLVATAEERGREPAKLFNYLARKKMQYATKSERNQ